MPRPYTRLMLAPAETPLRLLVVDDSSAFRGRVRRYLADDPAIDVVGEVGNGADALREIRELRPDVVLLDLSMPPPDGFSVLCIVKGQFHPTKVVVLTSDASAMVRGRCDALQADAVIDKGQTAELLIPTLRRITTPRGERSTP